MEKEMATHSIILAWEFPRTAEPEMGTLVQMIYWRSTLRNEGRRLSISLGFLGSSVVKKPPAKAGDTSSIPRLGRSSGEANGNPLQYSCLGNPMDRRAWQVTVHGVEKKGRTRLSNETAKITTTKDVVSNRYWLQPGAWISPLGSSCLEGRDPLCQLLIGCELPVVGWWMTARV